MTFCKSIGCFNELDPVNEMDFCRYCRNISAANDEMQLSKEEAQSSGRDNDYWVADLKHTKRLPPCKVECEDLIEHFQMSFQEGEAFKALWRNGQMRIGNGKPGDSHLRNAEKVAHFGGRMEVIEIRALKCAS